MRAKELLKKLNAPAWLVACVCAVIAVFVFCAVFAQWIAPYDPTAMDFQAQMASFSLAHPLGCDLLGRDLLSRVIYGAQTVLLTAVCAVTLGCICGSLLGLFAGYLGGVADAVVMRFTEAVLSIPMLVLAMSIGLALNQSRGNLMIALAFSSMPSYTRIVRGQVRSLKSGTFVQAARIIGCSRRRTVLGHILPNCLSPIIVTATANMGSAILAEASLSYLGVGIPSEIPAWGSMVSEGFSYLDLAPRLSIVPGAAIMLTVLAFSLLGDWLQDCLNVRA